MLLPLLLLISASFLIPGDSEVVKSFNACKGFFFKETFPSDALTPLNPALICQRYKNKYFFATMYDRTKRIPIYSAYIYNPGSGERSKEWMIEPQLADTKYGKDMENERDTTIPVDEILASQATNDDYKNLDDIDRGHLNPVAHQPDVVSRAATFTLTNITPQYSSMNRCSWAKYETKTMVDFKKKFKCKKIYVITGVVPGNTSIAKGRVNYPSHLWSAACCEIDQKKIASLGAIVDNNIPPDGRKVPNVQEYKLKDLERELEGLLNKENVKLFGSSCY